ncbi:hypothetical protein BSLA_03r1651 [Burkholderia stabilis]|nr:hypothetical protein BSLA_03r1651 [Burkholderia stabilis]
MAPGQIQRLEAAKRKAQDIDLFQAKRVDEGGCVVRHVLDPVARPAGRRGDAATVVQDDFPALRQAIRHHRIPMIHATTKVLKEQQRRLVGAGIAPPTIGEVLRADIDESGLGSLVRIDHLLGSQAVRFLKPALFPLRCHQLIADIMPHDYTNSIVHKSKTRRRNRVPGATVAFAVPGHPKNVLPLRGMLPGSRRTMCRHEDRKRSTDRVVLAGFVTLLWTEVTNLATRSGVAGRAVCGEQGSGLRRHLCGCQSEAGSIGLPNVDSGDGMDVKVRAEKIFRLWRWRRSSIACRSS